MTLDNLLGKTLESVTADAATIHRLLDAAQCSLADAQLAGMSSEGRFDMAINRSCKAPMRHSRPMVTAP